MFGLHLIARREAIGMPLKRLEAVYLQIIEENIRHHCKNLVSLNGPAQVDQGVFFQNTFYRLSRVIGIASELQPMAVLKQCAHLRSEESSLGNEVAKSLATEIKVLG